MAACYNCKKRNAVLYWPEGYDPETGDPEVQSICSDCGGLESYD